MIGSAVRRVIGWSHGRRFASGVHIIGRLRPRRLLDFGCGDGTFIRLAMNASWAPEVAVGVEASPERVAQTTAALDGVPRVSVVVPQALRTEEHRARYDVVVCMEVLEHVVELDEVLDLLVSLVSRGGHLVVSVPVETGPIVLPKQALRRAAGWFRIADYPGTTSYTWGELMSALFAGEHPHIERPVHHSPDAGAFFDHKGFNWRVVRSKISARATHVRAARSPFTWLPAGLATQVWLIAEVS